METPGPFEQKAASGLSQQDMVEMPVGFCLYFLTPSLSQKLLISGNLNNHGGFNTLQLLID